MAAPTTNTSLPSKGLGRSVPVAYRIDPNIGPSALPREKYYIVLMLVILMINIDSKCIDKD
jgi:hypothetical protein